jgi:hypothetical protein
LKVIRAVTQHKVYYDPGIKMENISASGPAIKRRSQFRITSKDIPVLYDMVESVDLQTVESVVQ